MKRIVILLVFALAATQTLWAQDVIITRQSERIDATVIEVSENTVKYKKHSNPDGPVFVLGTDKISSILYANGEVQAFGGSKGTPSPAPDHGVTLVRDGTHIVSTMDYEEPDNIAQLLGPADYEYYLDAQRHMRSGITAVIFGWLNIPLAAFFIGNGYSNNNPEMAIAGYVLAAASDILHPVGYVVRGVNAGKISRIAERYNAGQAGT